MLLWGVCVLLLLNEEFTQGVYETSSQRLASLADEFQTWRLSQRPRSATSRNVYTFNDRLKSFNYTRYEHFKDFVDGLYERLVNISEVELPRQDKISFKVLRYTLEAFRDGYQWRFYVNLNPVNFLEGVQKDVTRMTSTPMNTRGDVENYLHRLTLLPQQISEIKESFQQAVQNGTTYHNASMFRLPEQFDQVTNIADDKMSPLYKPFIKSVENNTIGFSDTERQTVIDRATSAIASALDSLRDLKSYLTNDYTTRSGIGVSSLHNGGEYYKACMKAYLSLDTTPDDVHQTGKREVARIEQLMMKIITKQGYNLSIREYFTVVMNQSQYFYNTGEELLEAYRQIIRDVDPTLTKLFKDLPGLPIIVVARPNDGPQGSYSTGTADGRTPGTFTANVLRPGDIPKFGLMALTLHEASPGHHLQISYSLTSNMPSFRQNIVYDMYLDNPVGFPSHASFSEGWALYAEGLGEKVGLYKDDMELMGRYSSEIFRACRLVVDTGMHYFNWDREQAIQYVLNYTAFTYATAATEIDRYITWPGQALTYKIGELKILELRKRAEQRLGNQFNVRDFHAVILENGRMPLNVLEEIVDDWLENYVPMTTETPTVCSSAESNGRVLSLVLAALFLPVILRSNF
ncbi:uncharacterized protein LOC124126558 isoform X2 [Haliotis rufescens]|uniref:uncharacterized protein LOC124126558 isoform X2 n=1 Tax=Haliotis rufescens TaxID=6454 RepID=UPI00201E9658|nr:uncharacterized protein LOC124126558 isoform X2 [Haliotis rufescens]